MKIMQPAVSQIEISQEENEAFEKAFRLKELPVSVRRQVQLSCAASFVLGYRASKGSDVDKGPNSREEGRIQLSELINYPNAWNTEAYPIVEWAAIEALKHSRNETRLAEKALEKSSDGRYTMDDMRDYASGVVSSRNYVVIEALETTVSECLKNAQSFVKSPDVSGVYQLIAAELRTIVDNVRNLGAKSFQNRAMYWAKKCFGQSLAMDPRERNQRFIEEGLELVQSCGMTRREAIGAVNYVYNRPLGEKRQEAGGVYTTLALLCKAQGIDMVGEGERDLLEIDNETTTARIREKRQTKPDFEGVFVPNVPISKEQFIARLDPAERVSMTYTGGTLNPSGELAYALVKKLCRFKT